MVVLPLDNGMSIENERFLIGCGLGNESSLSGVMKLGIGVNRVKYHLCRRAL